MFRYQFTNKAAKEIKKLPKEIQRQIFEDILFVCKTDYPLQSRNVLKLKGSYNDDTFRLRSGSYRIIFRIISGVIVIDSVRNRQQGY